MLGSKYADRIRAIRDEGHEIGLHGGRNHETWARLALTWPDEVIRDEVAWGLEQLSRLGVEPRGFSSPGGVSDPRVRAVVSTFANFDYISDRLEPRCFAPVNVGERLPDIPVALSGEGGVAYIESQMARGHSLRDVAKEWRARLQEHPAQIVYDHPYLAGDEGLPFTKRLVDIAREDGSALTTLSSVAKVLVRRPAAA